jgi:transposase
MLEQLMAGENDAESLSKLARGRLRKKTEQLQLALQGGFREHHRFMLRQLLAHLDQQIQEFSGRIEAVLAPFVSKRLSGN